MTEQVRERQPGSQCSSQLLMVFTIGIERFLLSPLLSLASVLLAMNPSLPFPSQGGASRAAEVSSRRAGELGYGGPSR